MVARETVGKDSGGTGTPCSSIKVDGRPGAIVRRCTRGRYPSTMMLRAEGPGICNPGRARGRWEGGYSSPIYILRPRDVAD